MCIKLYILYSLSLSADNCFWYFSPNSVGLICIAAKDHRNNKLGLSNFTDEVFFTCWLFLLGWICFQGAGNQSSSKNRKFLVNMYTQQASGKVWSRAILKVLAKEILRVSLWSFVTNEILATIY